MLRNFDAPILDLDGQPVRAGVSPEALQKAIMSVWPTLPKDIQEQFGIALDKEAGKEMTLGSASIGALMGVYQDEKLDDVSALSRVEIARKILRGGMHDIDPKERDLIKSLIGKKYLGPLVRTVVCEMLEQEAALAAVSK